MRTCFRPIAAALLLVGFAAAPSAVAMEAMPPPAMVEDIDDRAFIDAIEEAEALEPEVTIRRQGDATVEEYRMNGRLYMVKITPSRGYPYYLIDTNGDGTFDTRRNELDAPGINKWILFRW